MERDSTYTYFPGRPRIFRGPGREGGREFGGTPGHARLPGGMGGRPAPGSKGPGSTDCPSVRRIAGLVARRRYEDTPPCRCCPTAVWGHTALPWAGQLALRIDGRRCAGLERAALRDRQGGCRAAIHLAAAAAFLSGSGAAGGVGGRAR